MSSHTHTHTRTETLIHYSLVLYFLAPADGHFCLRVRVLSSTCLYLVSPLAFTRVISPHDEIVIPGEGMPKRGSYSFKKKAYSYGDLKVHMHVAFPHELGAKQKDEIKKILRSARR